MAADSTEREGGRNPPLSRTAVAARLALIGLVALSVVAGLAYAHGWLTPGRLTPPGIVDTFERVNGRHPGFRRNHAKGVCATGYFVSNGRGARVSKAVVFAPGRVPLVARFAFGGGDPHVADAASIVRSLALQFLLPDGEEWRTGMINLPVFPVRTPQAFEEQLVASRPDPATGRPDPARMAAFLASHPESARVAPAIQHRAISSGFADSPYHGLNAFRLVDASGVAVPARWSLLPERPFVAADPAAPTPPDRNNLFDALVADAGRGPLRWHLVATVGRPGDPTDDATAAWPEDRERLDVGTVTLDRIEGEATGRCRDVNYDPLVLPAGIEPSDDPLLSARSATYSVSFTRRVGEPHTPSAVQVPGAPQGGER
jgi:catalase